MRNLNQLKDQKNLIPSMSEVLEIVMQLNPRLQKQPILQQIKKFYDENVKKEEKKVPDKEKVVEEPQIQKKAKLNQLNMDQEQILQLPQLKDVGAIESIQSQIQSMIYLPLEYNHLFTQLGSQAPRGILLTGTTGSGKTYLAKAICRDLYEKHNLTIFIKNGAEIVASLSGESEKNIRQIFQQAQELSPSVILIDDIDVIAGDRDKASKQMERRVVTQLMGCVDSLPNNVFLIATTSHPDSLDPGLRRSGRFDKEIMINVPTDSQRQDIINKIIQQLKTDQIDTYELSRITPGFVASDLNALCKEAAVEAVTRLRYREEIVNIIQKDFNLALKKVQPTAKREGFAVIPDVTWNDIGSLQDLRQQLLQCIVLPIQNPEIFQKFAVRPPAGVLLWGPPGCGKTLLAKGCCQLKGPEILNKYVGESEKAIRGLFQRARASMPCIIFFDEIDAICPIRGSEGGNQVSERVVNQLLTELDGFEDRKQVFIIAASNRPDILDPAILRPGRIDKPLFVPLPDRDGRVDILKALSRKSPVDEQVDFIKLSESLDNYTGADLQHLITTAALNAILGNRESITNDDFIHASQSIKPSMNEGDRRAYQQLKLKFEK
ncbi:hypothetical protein pb186bvf_014643 [Paramecium bursaria]